MAVSNAWWRMAALEAVRLGCRLTAPDTETFAEIICRCYCWVSVRFMVRVKLRVGVRVMVSMVCQLKINICILHVRHPHPHIRNFPVDNKPCGYHSVTVE